MKRSHLLVLSTLILLGGVTLGSCGNNTPETPDVGDDDDDKTPVTYTVSFEVESVEGQATPTTVKPVTAEAGESITLPTPTKSGYIFDGWYVASDYSGDPLTSTYTVTKDVTLYGRRDEASTLFVYYGDQGEFEELTYKVGTEVSVEDFPDPGTITVKDTVCDFSYWAFMDGNVETGKVPDTFIANEVEYVIQAIYDESNVPATQPYEVLEDGFYRFSKKNNWAVMETSDVLGTYEADIRLDGINSGAVGIAFRGSFNNVDNSYEAGSNYVSVQLGLDKGLIQVSSVVDGDWEQLEGSKPPFASYPQAYQDKMNAYKQGTPTTFHLKVEDRGTSFRAFVDGNLVYQSDVKVEGSLSGRAYNPDDYQDKGFGYRESAANSEMGNFKYTAPANVTFETNGGSAVESMKYVYGELPEPTKDGKSFGGWYKDEALTEPVDKLDPALSGDVTLYAKWTDGVVVNFYVNGEVWKTAEVGAEETLDLSAYTPEPIVVNGISCPFMYWVKKGTDEKVDTNFNVGTANVDLEAVFDTSEAGNKTNVTIDKTKGTFTSTGEMLYVTNTNNDETAEFSADISLKPLVEGESGLFVNGLVADKDFAYEEGSTYLFAMVNGVDGSLSVGLVNNGQKQELKKLVLTELPQAFQNKVMSAATSGTNVTGNLKIARYESAVDVYIDNELAFSYSDASLLALSGTQFGVKASKSGTTFSNVKIDSGLTVTLNTNGGEALEPVVAYKDLKKVYLPEPTKSGSTFAGWYYDEALTKAVDEANFEATTDLTLYAKWSTEGRLVTFVTNCDTELPAIRYTEGALTIPELTYSNHIFTGWYYDEALTQKVDLANPVIESDTTLYAGWRLPASDITKNADGSYTIPNGSKAIVIDDLGSKTMTIEMKGSFTNTSGAIGIALFTDVGVDNFYEKDNVSYICAQIQSAKGGLQVGTISNNKFANIQANVEGKSNSPVAIGNLPQKWQDKWNAFAADMSKPLEYDIKVVTTETNFQIYLEGELAYDLSEFRSDAAEFLKPFTGTGVGIRSSLKMTTTCTFTYEITK